jgi:hypothetical protein
MRQIWKFDLSINGVHRFRWPVGAKLVHVGTQDPDSPELVQLWVLLENTQMEQEDRRFVVRGTGHPLHDDEEYVGTVLTFSGRLVWHVFEVKGEN